MAISKQEALMEDYFHVEGDLKSNGHCKTWRRNGGTKTWKTRPLHFSIPVKYGMYDYWHITHSEAGFVHLERECPKEMK